MEQMEAAAWRQAVAATLRAERGVAELTQADMSRLTGIARTSYRLYELGDRMPDIPQVAMIAEALGITIDRFTAEVARRVQVILETSEKEKES